MHVVGDASKRQFSILCPDQYRRQVLSKQPLHDREYRLIFVTLAVRHFWIAAFHLLPVPAMGPPDRHILVPWRYYAVRVMTFQFQYVVALSCRETAVFWRVSGRVACLGHPDVP